MPNVLEKTRRNAEPMLKAIGFEVGKITYRNHYSKEVLEMRHDGRVLKPGTLLPQTSKIDLILGDGKGQYSIPSTSNDDDTNDETR